MTTVDRRAPTGTLGLWMNGAYVGSWTLGPNAPDTLQYDPDWTRSEQGRPLSLSLPFMPGNLPHRGPQVRAWFENLLPDSKDILRRHWLELGTRHGVVTADGRPAQAVLDDLVAITPEALNQVRAQLPPGFPAEVADSILAGVQSAAARLAHSPVSATQPAWAGPAGGPV